MGLASMATRPKPPRLDPLLQSHLPSRVLASPSALFPVAIVGPRTTPRMVAQLWNVHNQPQPPQQLRQWALESTCGAGSFQRRRRTT